MQTNTGPKIRRVGLTLPVTSSVALNKPHKLSGLPFLPVWKKAVWTGYSLIYSNVLNACNLPVTVEG